MSSRTKMLHFGLLIAVSLAFFIPVRNNPFWHPDDFLYLNQAMDVRLSWKHIFATTSHQPFQPLVKFVFYAEYALFGLNAWKYYLFNIALHSINAFLVFLLVQTLLKRPPIAILSSLLFACAVGNYGKAVMVVSGISDLLITFMTLLTLLLYFKFKLERGGYLFSGYFLAVLFCFVLVHFTKATTFGILGCMFAFNVFFRSETRRPILSRDFIVIAFIATTALVVKALLRSELSGGDQFVFGVLNFFRNYASYLVRMVFPIHASKLIEHAGPAVQFVYQLATEIRVLTFICIVSFSVFGLIFGNRTIRFFIAWMYITVTPFCFFTFPSDWLDIRHLYLVSVGFVMVLASATVLAADLLRHRKVRRILPYTLPLLFIFLSQFIITGLDIKYELIAQLEPIRQLENQVLVRHEEMNSPTR